MAGDILRVLLEGRPVATLERLPRGGLRLRHDDDLDPSSTPLSVSMPVTDRVHRDSAVSPWAWGLLPDNADVVARWGRDFGVSTATPYGLLSTSVGHDCAGAVQFCAPDAVDDLISRQGELIALTEADVADRLRALRRDATSWLGGGFAGQFSLGGAQAKTALHRRDDTWFLATGAAPTTHIIKPAVPGFDDQDLDEHLCMTAARTAGLAAAHTELASFEDQTAVVVRRFDRIEIDGRLVRVHQEDCCQALGLHPSRKYQAEGGPSAADIVGLLRSLAPAATAEPDVWRFVDALAFNWVIAGTDAHAKNYALLLSGTQARLAPLYDVASVLPYDDSDGYRVKLAMKVGDDYKLRRTDRRSAWEHAADHLGLDRNDLIDRVVALAERVPGAFAEAAGQAEADGQVSSDLPGRLVDLVTVRAALCAAVLG